MKIFKECKKIRIYTSNTDSINHKPIYQVIAHTAKKCGLSGATVFKGIMGYGGSSELQSDFFWELIEKYPVVVEIVDSKDSIDNFLKVIIPIMEGQPKGYLITSQDIEIINIHKNKINQ